MHVVCSCPNWTRSPGMTACAFFLAQRLGIKVLFGSLSLLHTTQDLVSPKI
jgi:hypothetical protein